MIDTFEASSLQEAHYFAEQIEEWYLNNKRELPWRDIKDPYRFLKSSYNKQGLFKDMTTISGS